MLAINSILVALAQTPIIPDAPEGETQAEKILIWGIVLCVMAIVAMFVWCNRIHAGHKKQIREQEQAYRTQLRDQTGRDQELREKVSDRLFGLGSVGGFLL